MPSIRLPAKRPPTAEFEAFPMRRWRRLAWLCAGLLSTSIHAWGHNLDMRTDYLGYDKATLDMFQARAAAGQSLIQVGDTIGLLMKATPNLGTPTGAGGYSTLFVPVGTQVIKADYGRIDSSGQFLPMAVKGQSILALGDGARGAQLTPNLIGLQLGPNINGQTALAVDASGYANGTMVGVYSDTGIFYSTDPKTAWQSWVNTGGMDNNVGTPADNYITTNRGIVVTPPTRWDAEQLIAFGMTSPYTAILDPQDQRGNAPWGMASAVAGPHSSYAWAFNKTYWDGHPNQPVGQRTKNSIAVGPWKRIQYEGSQMSDDMPGLRSSALGYANKAADRIGYNLSPANPLPATTSWTDSSSPKAVRIAWGNTELYHPEYARVQVKILVGPGQPSSAFDAAGYLQAYADTFGGDAGGEYNNFDHLWRYYKPTTATLAGHPFIFKQTSKPLVLPNEDFSYTIWVINFGSTTLTNVQIDDTLPNGELFLSAVPAATSGPNPLRWTFPVLLPGTVQTITINVRATGTGLMTNTVCSSSNQYPTECSTDTTVSVSMPLLYADKTVTPTTAQPGGTVNYTMLIANEGTAQSPTPLTIKENLPTGFSYNGFVSAKNNGVDLLPGALTIAVPSATHPVFTVNTPIPARTTLAITFKAKISVTEPPGTYYNSYSFTNSGKVNSTGALAGVTVSDVRLGIGNLVFFDANGDGLANPGEGVSGVTVELYTEDMTAGVDTPLATAVTDASGQYLFDNLEPGVYYVHIPKTMFQSTGPLYAKVAIAATLFGDDDVGQDGLNDTDPPLQGVSGGPVYLFPGQAPTDENGETGVNSASDNDNDASVDLTVDFGFQIPVGIGNLVFIDANHNSHADPGEGVGGVSVEIYDAATGVNSGQYLFSTTTTSNGHYLFDHLSTGNYVVHIPAVNFQPGHPLAGLLSLPDVGAPVHSDDNVGENGIDAISPIYTGISSDLIHLEPGLAPVDASVGSTNGETGFLASEDNANDNKIDLTIDFGFTDSPSPVCGVGNLVFKEADGDFFYEDGEGLKGVTVQLFTASVSNPLSAPPLRTTVTANGGEYYFGNLLPGNYYVFIPPSNFSSSGALKNCLSIPGQGGDDGLDDDQDENGDDPVDPSVSGVKSNIFNLAVGTEPTGLQSEFGFNSYVDDGSDANNDLTIDFGFYEPVGVGNVVFKDLNGNGRYDAGEGVNGVTLQLFSPGADPQTNLPLATTVSANGGRYSFNRLRPGSYFVYIPGSNFAIGQPLNGLLSVPDTSTSWVGDDNQGEDGIDSPNPLSNGISSREFTLITGAAPTDATTEKGVGAADDNTTDADFDATIDFGFYDTNTPLLGIGNVVFNDLNHNGHYDAGEGVPGVHVQLFPATANLQSDAPVSVSVTDADGSYLLRTNAPGDYLVFIPYTEFEQGGPLFGLMSIPGNGTDNAVDDDADENGIDSAHPNITGISSTPIHLAAGTEPVDGPAEAGFHADSDNAADSHFDLTVDFGFDHICPTFTLSPATLPGMIQEAAYPQTFSTTDGYGPYTWEITAGAPPEGLVLSPTGAFLGNATVVGTYNFTVQVTDATGCTGTADYQIVVSPIPTVGLGNCVYLDVNHNGVNDGNEGLADVEVELFHAGDDPMIDGPIAEVDTDATGRYSFEGLTPGDYFIYIPAGEFAVGKPLYGCLSVPGTAADNGVDDNLPGNDNGIDNAHPELNGIFSNVVHLALGTEPVDGVGETGFDATHDNAGGNDANFDATIDFGFQASCPTIVVTPSSLPSATEGNAYNQSLQATGGVAPLTFSITAGLLPSGISLSPLGVIAGTPENQGAYAFTIRATDANGCSTDVPSSLVVSARLAVGNLVFFDANANGHADAGEGIDGVTVELYRSTDTPGTSTPLASTITANGGRYLIDGLGTGQYVLFIPKTMFATGAPLANMKSVPGAMTSGDDDTGEHGLDNATPTSNGIATAVFSLSTGSAPTIDDGETGTDAASDDARDANIDLTQDFGFVDVNALPATFTDWAGVRGLSGNNALPTANPDGDAYGNLIEYALGLSPTSGADDIGAVFSVIHNANGGVDVRLRRRHGSQADLTYTIELLPKLTNATWATTSISPTVTNNVNGTETLNFASISNDLALAGGTDGFVRIRVSLDANHDSIAEATATSIILGWQRRPLGLQNQTYAVPYAPAAVFTGTVGAVTGSTLDLTAAAGGANLTTLFVTGKEYYVEAMNGAQQGHRWEVNEAASTAASLVLDPAHARSTQATVPASLAGTLIALRRHWCVSDLFPPADYHATNSATTADQVLLWDPATSGYVTLWLANYFGQSHWHQVGVAALNATEDNRVLAPADGFFARPRVGAVTGFATGQLRTWQFAMPLQAGTNFVGNPFPVAQSPVERVMTTANGFTGKTNPVLSDRIYFWNGDTDSTATGYTTYHLLKSGTLEIWKIVGSTDLSTNLGLQKLFLNSRSGFINSISGQPNWVIPAPAVP